MTPICHTYQIQSFHKQSPPSEYMILLLLSAMLLFPHIKLDEGFESDTRQKETRQLREKNTLAIYWTP
jgi:hypothetical protein